MPEKSKACLPADYASNATQYLFRYPIGGLSHAIFAYIGGADVRHARGKRERGIAGIVGKAIAVGIDLIFTQKHLQTEERLEGNGATAGNP